MAFLFRTLSFFKSDRSRIALLVLLIGLSVAVGLLQAWPMAILGDTVLSPYPHSGWMQELFLAPLPSDRVSQINGITIIGMCLKLAQDALTLFRTMLNHSLRYRGTSRVRMALFDKLQSLGVAWQKQQPQGDGIYRLSTDAIGAIGVLGT